MSKRSLFAIALALVSTGLAVTPAPAGQVNVGVSISVPPPPKIVLPAPPPVVVVPHSPVSYAPSVDFNLFVYGGRYYTFHEGSWFYAQSHRGPWLFIAPDRVPRPVVGVPANYYKIPPGHAKKMARSGAPGGPGPSEGGFCPPGQAKKGRC